MSRRVLDCGWNGTTRRRSRVLLVVVVVLLLLLPLPGKEDEACRLFLSASSDRNAVDRSDDACRNAVREDLLRRSSRFIVAPH